MMLILSENINIHEKDIVIDTNDPSFWKLRTLKDENIELYSNEKFEIVSYANLNSRDQLELSLNLGNDPDTSYIKNALEIIDNIVIKNLDKYIYYSTIKQNLKIKLNNKELYKIIAHDCNNKYINLNTDNINKYLYPGQKISICIKPIGPWFLSRSDNDEYNYLCGITWYLTQVKFNNNILM